MRLKKARLEPQEADSWSAEVQELMRPFVEAGSEYNIFKTLTHHPDLMRRWMVFANHVLFKSTLPLRERELVILRIGYLCQAGYEWGQHAQVARKAGMSDAEILTTKTGPETPGISELDKLLMQATDELHADSHISDATWAALEAQNLDKKQLMDLVFTVGQYTLVSMALNTLGVQPDDGLPDWDLKPQYKS
ncbi:MAG: carboxymuconolactone decarboxylase family protein [Proteobacteria bacterium]|nr:carboxymuconolactone decarboxylase family protein [Pseudomonadota bacterium]